MGSSFSTSISIRSRAPRFSAPISISSTFWASTAARCWSRSRTRRSGERWAMALRDIEVNLYDRARLQRQFGAFLRTPTDRTIGLVERELAGEGYERILRETSRLIAHQWRAHIE